ncbi:MAG: hypothetical protein H0U59_00755 [Gemmatimonadaceae bacterium]|nr:hypothetical protein [Gemmatimonadaceae bacterium]
MARYSLGSRTTATASGVANWELRSTATDRLRVMELGIVVAAATASTFGLGRPAAIGVTPTSPVTILAEDSGDAAGTGTVALAWGTAPTAPTGSAYLRRVATPASIGAGIVWTFGENGLVVPISSSIVIYNLSTTGVADIYVVVDE